MWVVRVSPLEELPDCFPRGCAVFASGVLVARGWGRDEAMEVDGLSSTLALLYPGDLNTWHNLTRTCFHTFLCPGSNKGVAGPTSAEAPGDRLSPGWPRCPGRTTAVTVGPSPRGDDMGGKTALTISRMP